MAFKVRCPKCQKVYAADDQWVGKRIRCKSCGEGFIVEEPTGEIDVQPAAPVVASSGSKTRMAPPQPAAPDPRVPAPGSGPAPARQPAAARSTAPTIEQTDDDFDVYGDERPTLRGSVPQDFPMSNVVEAWLPLALGLISILLCASQIVSQNETGLSWVAALRFSVCAILFFLLIVPATYKTIAICFQKLRRILPPNPLARVAATFALPAALAIVFWQGIGGVGGFATGLIMGLVMMAAVFWLLFRLTPQEAANTYAWAGGIFLATSTISALIVVGSSSAINRVMIDNHVTTFRESPLGASLAWTAPEPAAVKKAQPTQAPQPSDSAVASGQPATPPTTGTKVVPPVVQETPSDAIVAPQTATTSESIPSPLARDPGITGSSVTPPAPYSSSLFTNPDDDQFTANLRKKALPWVKQISRATVQGSFDFIVPSCNSGPYIGLVALDPNSVGARKFSVGFASESGFRASASLNLSDGSGTPRSFSHDYFLTPDGTAVLHADRNEIEIIPTGQKKHESMKLTAPVRQSSDAISAQIVGIARDQSVVVRWSGAGGADHYIQRYSYATLKLLESSNFHEYLLPCDVSAVSANPTGPVWYATVVGEDGKRPLLYLHNATSSNSEGRKTPLPPELSDVTHYDAELVFSPNGSKIVLMLADNDRTIIYEWLTTSLGAPSLRLSLPALPADMAAVHVVGPRIRWIDDLFFIVDGQSVVGTVPNRVGVLGTLSDTPALAMASFPNDRALLSYVADGGACHLVEVEFDPAALREATPIKEPSASH